MVEADGVMCVVNEEERENVEQEEDTQCTQQNVTQGYSSYVTKYTDSVREKCEEVFIKTCRIIMRSRAYNHTTRICKRPLLKQCNSYEPPVKTNANLLINEDNILEISASNIWRIWSSSKLWIWKSNA